MARLPLTLTLAPYPIPNEDPFALGSRSNAPEVSLASTLVLDDKKLSGRVLSKPLSTVRTLPVIPEISIISILPRVSSKVIVR
jgi:hypothetical protein